MMPADSPGQGHPVRRQGPADMKPCRQCGTTDPRRMIALMTLWFGRFAGVDPDGGYFYLCPSCYEHCIAPHFAPVVDKLARRHTHMDGDDAGNGSAHDDPDPPPP
jgi:hypothetical protein